MESLSLALSLGLSNSLPLCSRDLTVLCGRSVALDREPVVVGRSAGRRRGPSPAAGGWPTPVSPSNSLLQAMFPHARRPQALFLTPRSVTPAALELFLSRPPSRSPLFSSKISLLALSTKV
ncbi:hypothetical protein NL676_033561 [Syzygium grande]|nr:hypothetical protein NL676_033561 [Syzygium grande]